MTTRDKRFLIILSSAVAGVGLIAFLGLQWFWNPLQSYNTKIGGLRDDNEKLQADLELFFKEKKKLELAKLKSLPSKPDQATTEYLSYLKDALEGSGLRVETYTPSSPLKVKPPASVPGIKDVGHQTLTFTVKANGELAQLVQAMEQMQKTPYDHRIKNLSIDRSDTSYGKDASSKLKIDMVIEVLLVAKTANRPGLPPGLEPKYLLCDFLPARSGVPSWGLIASALAFKQVKDAMPAPVYRDYADIARKNIFVGAVTIKPPAPPTVAKEATGPAPPPEKVPAYVRLIQTVPDLQEAYLFNRVYKSREIKVIARQRSGYEFFRITDENGEYVFFQAKALRVGPRDMYFQVKNMVYALHLGQTLDEAMRFPLTIEEMDEMDLFDFYDAAWAKEQMGNEKTKTSSKNKKGGKTR
jgi:hypothetical protein